MRNTLILCLAFFSFSIGAITHIKLSSGELAYYGEEFYRGKVSKSSLFHILQNNHISTPGKHDQIVSACGATQCYRHSSVGYDGARKIMFGEIFLKNDSRGKHVEDAYCGKKFYFREVSDISNMSSEVNIEHTWPQSRFNGNFDKNLQKSDMHHLYPTDSMANNRRANHPFGEVGEQHDELNVQNCEMSRLGDIKGHFIFTPPTSHRGNVARSLFYFSTRYNLPIGTAEELILREWHKIDPVDAEEIARHEIIAKYQKVRNPFIDYPATVQKISDF